MIETILPVRYFVEGLTEVISTMTGMVVYEKQMAGNSNIQGDVISGAMMLDGSRNALLVLTAEKPTAETLVAYMTGSDPSEIMESELFDGMGELVNMIAGIVKVRLSDTDFGFRLTSPFAIAGQGTRMIVKRGIDVFQSYFETGEVKLYLDLYYF